MIAWYEEEITQVPIRHPCEKWCPYEWGSKECFIRREYEYDWHNREWVRDEQGKPVIGKKQCDWEPKEDIDGKMQIMRSTDYVGPLTVRKTNAGKP